MVIIACRWTYYKKQYTCALALCFFMKLDGIVGGVLDDDFTNSFHSIYLLVH